MSWLEYSPTGITKSKQENKPYVALILDSTKESETALKLLEQFESTLKDKTVSAAIYSTSQEYQQLDRI